MVSNDLNAIPLVDMSMIEPILQLAGAERVQTIIDSFWVSVEELLNQFLDAYLAQDQEAYKRAAHSIKGAAANIGANRLSEIARQLENASDDETKALFVELETCLRDTRPAIAKKMAQAA